MPFFYLGTIIAKRNSDTNKLINFVKSARQRKMNDKEITSALEKKGWKEKQINYAFKRAK